MARSSLREAHILYSFCLSFTRASQALYADLDDDMMDADIHHGLDNGGLHELAATPDVDGAGGWAASGDVAGDELDFYDAGLDDAHMLSLGDDGLDDPDELHDSGEEFSCCACVWKGRASERMTGLRSWC